MCEKKECPLCGESAQCQLDYQDSSAFYICPVCGCYELKASRNFNPNTVAPYIFYDRFLSDSNLIEYRYHTFCTKEDCDKYNKAFVNGDNVKCRPVHMDNDLIEAWYPKTFSERVDYIIKYLGTHIEHIGQRIIFSYPEMLSLLFIDRIENNKTEMLNRNKRERSDCFDEAKYMLDSLEKSDIIQYELKQDDAEFVSINLTPKGYARIDELQKNTAYGKAVLVAMKFGDDTIPLRKAIRKGITNAGYVAVFIDEVQHNDFITPELLKHIRDSKFVVVDLTHQNNGAYFEEGYAMGLGKPVIQLCKHDTKLHFDIAQKNTIMWQTEDDIPEKLCNRIKATID